MAQLLSKKVDLVSFLANLGYDVKPGSVLGDVFVAPLQVMLETVYEDPNPFEAYLANTFNNLVYPENSIIETGIVRIYTEPAETTIPAQTAITLDTGIAYTYYTYNFKPSQFKADEQGQYIEAMAHSAADILTTATTVTAVAGLTCDGGMVRSAVQFTHDYQAYNTEVFNQDPVLMALQTYGGVTDLKVYKPEEIPWVGGYPLSPEGFTRTTIDFRGKREGDLLSNPNEAFRGTITETATLTTLKAQLKELTTEAYTYLTDDSSNIVSITTNTLFEDLHTLTIIGEHGYPWGHVAIPNIVRPYTYNGNEGYLIGTLSWDNDDVNPLQPIQAWLYNQFSDQRLREAVDTIIRETLEHIGLDYNAFIEAFNNFLRNYRQQLNSPLLPILLNTLFNNEILER